MSSRYFDDKPTHTREAYMDKIKRMQAKARGEKWCKCHPTSKWAPGFKQCAEGFRKHEVCEEGKNE